MQTSESEHSRPKKRIFITLKPAAYRNLWIILIVLHAIHAAAFGDEAYVFFNTLVNDSSLNRGLQAYRLDNTFNAAVSAAMVFTSGFVCVWHGLSVARALFWSFRQGKLAFHRLHSSSYQESRILKSWSTRQISGAIVPPLRKIHSAWLSVFGLDSRHFDDVRDVRELVEIGTQTYLVYFTSKTISSRVLTSFGAIALMLNCWSTPLIGLVWSRDESKARYFRLLVGIWLACCFTIGMRALEYYTFINDHAVARWYNIEWTVNNLSQLLHMIINSWSDMTMSRLNLLTMTIAMETLKARVQHPAIASMAPRIVLQDAIIRSSAVVPFGPVISSQSETRQEEVPTAKSSTRHRRVLFYIYGTVICGLHVNSSLQSSFVELHEGAICHVEVRPWLQAYSSCLALESNCHRLGIEGSASELEAELTNVNTNDLQALIISHCPRLEMPQMIQEFEKLFGLEIYNSSIVRWDEDAALTMDFHPALAVFRLILVQGIVELPAGLLSSKFPATDIELILTDLASLPDDLSTKWPPRIEILAIEGSQLGQIPEFVTKVHVSQLFLSSNGIETIPPSLFVNRSYDVLMLNGNPIQDFPSSLSPTQAGNESSTGGGATEFDSFRCTKLLIQATGIRAIPEWVLSATESVFAGATPLCFQSPLSEGNDSQSRFPLISSTSIDCTPFPYAITMGFPLPLQAQLRAP